MNLYLTIRAKRCIRYSSQLITWIARSQQNSLLNRSHDAIVDRLDNAFLWHKLTSVFPLHNFAGPMKDHGRAFDNYRLMVQKNLRRRSLDDQLGRPVNNHVVQILRFVDSMPAFRLSHTAVSRLAARWPINFISGWLSDRWAGLTFAQSGLSVQQLLNDSVSIIVELEFMSGAMRIHKLQRNEPNSQLALKNYQTTM